MLRILGIPDYWALQESFNIVVAEVPVCTVSCCESLLLEASTVDTLFVGVAAVLTPDVVGVPVRWELLESLTVRIAGVHAVRSCWSPVCWELLKSLSTESYGTTKLLGAGHHSCLELE